MDAFKTRTFLAQRRASEPRSLDPVAALRRELGSFAALDEDPDETWEGEWVPGELEARLAFYAAQ